MVEDGRLNGRDEKEGAGPLVGLATASDILRDMWKAWDETPLSESTCFCQSWLKIAVLACFGIVGETSGRFVIGQMGIFLLVASAAVLHSAGRTLERRLKLESRGRPEGCSMFQV